MRYLQSRTQMPQRGKQTMIDKTEPTKFILDACCGMKYMWMNKNHPNTIYMDIRKEEKGFNKNRPYDNVSPDIMGDFTDLSEVFVIL